MIRRPLRPLAAVIDARSRGRNPDLIERDNLRRRHEAMREGERQRAEVRLVVLAMLFLFGFGAVGARMAAIAASDPTEPRASRGAATITATRADIIDRRGNLLATNLPTRALYARPGIMIDPAHAARELARIFPDLDEKALLARFTSGKSFLWVRRRLSPEEVQAVHDIGEPGLLFADREMRLYPNGALAAHVLGGAGFGREDVLGAEIVGRGGVELTFDDRLSDPARAEQPLRLSIDLAIQAVVEHVLEGGMRVLGAKGASAVLMKATTGEIVALASLPDFDPNSRPAPPAGGDPTASPLFDRAVQGVYELGSVFKTFTIAQALEEGIAAPGTMVDTRGPLRLGRFRVRDFHDYGPRLSVRDVLVKSSNIGAARLAQEIGPERQRAFLGRLGLLDPAPVELPEARVAHPLLPARWTEISAMTISYGHGISVSPVQLAAAYASIVNGGHQVRPTLLAGASPASERVISAATSRQMREMLRAVVREGTATLAEVPGYEVGGKTGTADKPKPGGGYWEDRVIATFAAVFPAPDPAYVLVVTLDEPEDRTGPEPRRTAGWTAAPVAGEIIRRAAPLLGLAPAIAEAGGDGLTVAGN